MSAGVHPAYSDPMIRLRHYRPGESGCATLGCYNSLYLHVSDWVVTTEDQVEKGQLIGYTGASGASGFEHLHFEIRDAPANDPYSSWSRDAIHPFSVLPYLTQNDTSITFDAVDAADPGATEAEVTVLTNRYDLVAVEMTVLDENLEQVDQAGNTPDERGYYVFPSFFDMELWNFQYSHKNSGSVPWSSFGESGSRQCPYHADHGDSYDANVHMDQQHPDDYHQGLFNGVHVTTTKYWPGTDYWLRLRFLQLAGPAGCIMATAVFASGDTSTAEWGQCGTITNDPPTAAFTHHCNGLDCSFDAGSSSDTDGEIVSYLWDFGAGAAASGVTASHAFSAAGDYPVSLTVIDDKGAGDGITHTVKTNDPGNSEISLSLSTNRKNNRVALSWSGAIGNTVDIYKNGTLVRTTKNDGSWNDRDVAKGAVYDYRVCETGSLSACSADARISL